MSDALSFADLDGQYAELLPARTVMSTAGGSTSGDEAKDSAEGGGGGTGGIAILDNINILSVVNGDEKAGSGGDGGLGGVLDLGRR